MSGPNYSWHSLTYRYKINFVANLTKEDLELISAQDKLNIKLEKDWMDRALGLLNGFYKKLKINVLFERFYIIRDFKEIVRLISKIEKIKKDAKERFSGLSLTVDEYFDLISSPTEYITGSEWISFQSEFLLKAGGISL